jgi:predicted DNA-binding protein with PD1-like motif
MQHAEGKVGRVFAIRLEHGDRMPECLEKFAAEHNVRCGVAIMIGGAASGSRFVVGPELADTIPPVPILASLSAPHEVAAVGTLFPDEKGRASLHMHAAFGRREGSRCGCIRAGISTWHVLEVILIEILELNALRLADPETGFSLLQCGSAQASRPG